MKQYISIQEVDNGWIIERNAFCGTGPREKVVCRSGEEVVQHISKMVTKEES